jgi:hypothetical protein
VATTLPATEAWLKPLDRARTAVFVRALRVRPLRQVLLEKRRRVPALLLVHACAAFVLSVLAPTLLLVVGPLLLGVAHLVADLRYLVLRAQLATAARACLLGGSLLLLGLELGELFGFHALTRCELPLAAVWVATCAAFGARGQRAGRVWAIAAAAAAFAVTACVVPGALRLAVAHAHNVLAIVLWALVFRKERRGALALTAGLAIATLVLLASPLAWLGFKHGLQQALGLHAFGAAQQLAPFAQGAPLALGVVASFAFLQSVHYAVWLHAIPQEATPSEGTLSFRMSYRALRGDLGAWGLALAALLVALVPLLGLLAPLRTQATYLSLASFHAYLELAALSLWWVSGRGSR